jgi:photosystem II stability/assembly factor-like uncharacterized protein
MERVSPRGRRALVLIVLALCVLVAVGAAPLRTVLAPVGSSRATASPSPPPPAAWSLTSVSFGDGDHGAATLSGPGSTSTYLTSDGGRTWRRAWAGARTVQFLDRDHAVTVDPGGLEGFETSGDGGRTWHAGSRPGALEAASALPPGAPAAAAPFFLDATDGWWLGPGGGDQPRSLWRTTDGGRSWSDLRSGGIAAITDPIASQPAFADRLRGALVGPRGGRPDQAPALLATRDGGRTWQPVALTWPQASVGPFDAAVGRVVLVAHGDRLVLSVDLLVPELGISQLVRRELSVSGDGGLTWMPWTAAPGQPSIPSNVAVDDAGRLVQADDRRLWTSADLGLTWQSRPLPGPAGQLTAVVSARGGALFVVASPGAFSTSPTRLLRSVDGGDRWTEVHLPAVRP